MESLIDELALLIFDHLDHRSILRCEQVCMNWKRLVLDSAVWRRLFLELRLEPYYVPRSFIEEPIEHHSTCLLPPTNQEHKGNRPPVIRPIRGSSSSSFSDRNKHRYKAILHQVQCMLQGKCSITAFQFESDVAGVSRESNLIAAASSSMITVFNVDKMTPVQTFLDEDDQDGKRYILLKRMRLICASRNNTVKVFNISSGVQMTTLKGHFGKISLLNWDNPNVLFTGARDETVRAYDMRNFNLIHIFQVHERPLSLRLLGDQLFIACMNGFVYEFDLKSPDSPVGCIRFSFLLTRFDFLHEPPVTFVPETGDQFMQVRGRDADDVVAIADGEGVDGSVIEWKKSKAKSPARPFLDSLFIENTVADRVTGAKLCGDTVILSVDHKHVFRFSLSSPRHVMVLASDYLPGQVQPPTNSVHAFLTEFFHPDHGTNNTNVVIMLVREPTPDMLSMIKSNPVLKASVKLYQGSIATPRDLLRVRADHAKACFMFSKKSLALAAEDDASNVVRTLSVKRMVLNPMPIFTQAMRTESTVQFLASGVDSVIPISRLKMLLLANSTMCPGVSTMILNLVQSGYWDSYKNLDRWQEEYVDGAGQEIYRVPVNYYLDGSTFADVALTLYLQYQITLFGVETIIGDKPVILLNPGARHSLRQNDQMLVLADDRDTAWKAYEHNDQDLARPRSTGPPSRVVYRGDPTTGRDQCLLDIHTSAHLVKKSRREKRRDQTVNITSPTISSIPSTKELINLTPSQLDLQGSSQSIGSSSAEVSGAEEGTPAAAADHNDQQIESSQEMLILPNLSRQRRSKKEAAVESIEDTRISNHIIVCGSLDSLEDFILPLRSHHSNIVEAIVIIDSTPLDDHLWSRIDRFPEIYFIQGSPLDLNTLRRARSAFASKAIIISDRTGEEPDADAAQETFYADTNGIMTLLTLRATNPDINTIVELASGRNIHLTRESDIRKKRRSNDDEMVHPSFCAGHVYLGTSFDTLLAQAYFNPSLVSIVKRMISGGDEQDFSMQGVRNSRLYQVAMPPQFVGMTYDVLLENLLGLDVVSLGLYRGTKAMSSPVPYVMTAPKKSVVLQSDDRIFILA